ncbi:hypothetical protein Tco_1032887 [Tanacetum coccineum]|uniref:Uncharacterized protein n=1 Tax=Tanacetum coccineum TaxID=301880 RepID=A0ABQ5GEH9_9ASTR
MQKKESFHEMDSQIALSVSKYSLKGFLLTSDLLKPSIFIQRSFHSDREVMKQAVRLYSDEEIEKKEFGSTLRFHGKNSGRMSYLADQRSTDTHIGKDMEILVKTCLMPLALKTQNDSFAFVHELKQEMHADLKYVESLEDELDELESDKAEFSNMYDMLLQECVSKDVICSYLHSLDEITEFTYAFYLHKSRECECLAQKLSKQTESVNKEVHNNLLKSFSKLEKHSISLELLVLQCSVLHSNRLLFHNRSELGIQDHSNEQSSSKLVPKVVP